MKRSVTVCTLLAVLSAFLTACTNPYQNTANGEDFVPHGKVITLSAAAADENAPYSIEDVHQLRDFLAAHPSDGVSGDQAYDLDGDGIWNTMDLTLMKQAILANVISDDLPVVYMTKDISNDGLMNVYLAMGWQPSGNVAVKLSTGEPPASNYLRPELIKDVVDYVDGTIVECNTAYGGSRTSSAMHYEVAADHGFTSIADFKILDDDGSMSIPIEGGSVLSEDFVGAAFADYDSYLVLSHFKGHAMAGFGGAIKNISIGLGSAEGKVWIHSGGTRKTGSIMGKQDPFLESMAEAGKGVSDYLNHGENIAYVNVMNRLSVDCDCDGNPAEPDMHDIGILSSTDPVALDQACIDLVYEQKDGEGKSLVKRIESKNGLHTLEHAAEIGLGSREYQLVIIDD